jgi:VWFA-related protein
MPHSNFKNILRLLFLLTIVAWSAHAQTQSPVNGKSTGATDKSLQKSGTTSSQNRTDELNEGDTVRVTTTLVTIPVTVMDRNGHYIPNLQEKDFKVFENGVEQQIAYFAPVETPVTVALLLDVSDSTRFRIEDIQKAAIAFLDKLRSNDQVILIAFDDKIHVMSELTSNRECLHQAISRTQTGGGTRVYDAVNYALTKGLNNVRGRKAIVIFSDGVDTLSDQATYESVLHEANESEALIYTIHYDTYIDVVEQNDRMDRLVESNMPRITNRRLTVVPAIGASEKEHRRGREFLQEMAQKSGARFYSADSLMSLKQSFMRIAEELHQQYSLGYYPKNTPARGERRQIKVRVDKPDVVTRARNSYIF